MKISTRLKRLEDQLKVRGRRLVVLAKEFGESEAECLSRHPEIQGEDVDFIFTSKFADPTNPLPPAAKPLPPEEATDSRLEIATIIQQLKAEGLTEQEIFDEVYAEPDHQEEPPEETLSGECLEEKRRLEEMWARREPRGPGFLRPVEALRHDDLTALFTKKRGPVN
jgi:hypothetical protein